jgi:beta-glucoside operon transcriptional antiterminator
MRLTKKINNNVALGMDAQGRDVVVFGKGIGFHRMPHEVGAGDVVERVFRDVSKGTVDALSTVDADVLLAASDIVDLAGMQLDYKLSPNLPFTLADHIQFAIERGREGIDIDNPLAGEVALVYPSELTVARTGVAMINRRVNGANLPESEAANIALHLVSGELGGMGDSSSMDLVVRSTTIISRAADIVEKDAGVTLDRESFAFNRFAAHFRYLVARLMKELP